MKEKTLAFLTLFTSMGTLVCCALPALFVTLGMGAVLAGFLTKVPQLIWFSEHKIMVFGMGFVMLAIGGFLQWQVRNTSCPTDPKLMDACKTTRGWSPILYIISLGLYTIGAIFAFGSRFL